MQSGKKVVTFAAFPSSANTRLDLVTPTPTQYVRTKTRGREEFHNVNWIVSRYV